MLQDRRSFKRRQQPKVGNARLRHTNNIAHLTKPRVYPATKWTGACFLLPTRRNGSAGILTVSSLQNCSLARLWYLCLCFEKRQVFHNERKVLKLQQPNAVIKANTTLRSEATRQSADSNSGFQNTAHYN